MPSDKEKQLIDIILRLRMATREQIAQCLIERPVDSAPDIVQELLDRGMIDASQAKRARQAAGANGTETGPPEIDGYDIECELGRGTMGTVYKGVQRTMSRPVAIKVLPQKLTRNSKFIKRFITEARTAGKLNHPNIVQGIDVGCTAGGSYYFIMEYVEGETVRHLMKRKGKLDEQQALRIARDIASALDHVSSHHLVHRDIKPENIMLSSTGAAKLADLGLAAPVDELAKDDAQIEGTPHYIAPEIVRGDRSVDVRADIYSLGASLFHMLTGSVPFDGPSASVVMTKHLSEAFPQIRQREPGVSAYTGSLVARMTMLDKDQRYATAAALVEDIDRILDGEMPSCFIQGAAAKASGTANGHTRRRISKRSPAGLALGAGAFGAIALLIGLAVVLGPLGRPPDPIDAPPPPPPNLGNNANNHTPTSPEKPERKEQEDRVREERERLSNETLLAARQYQEEHPGDYAAIERMYNSVRWKYHDTPSADAAYEALKKLRQQQRENKAGEDLKKLVEETDQLLKDNEFALASGLFLKFIRQHKDSPAAAEAQKHLEAVTDKALAQFAIEKEKAEKLVQQKQFDQAIEVYRNAAQWDVVEVSRQAMEGIRSVRREMNRIAQEQISQLEREREAQRTRYAAAVAARDYSTAIAAADKLAEIARAGQQERFRKLSDEIRLLSGLREKIINHVANQPDTIPLTAQAISGHVHTADETGFIVKSGKVEIRVAWKEASSRQICRLARDSVLDDEGDHLLAVALLCAWEGEFNLARLSLGDAKAAGADITAVKERLPELEADDETREGNNKLAAIRQSIDEGSYAKAAAQLDDLRKEMGETAFYQANRGRIDQQEKECEDHRRECPACEGGGRVPCEDCNGTGSVVVTKKCPECAGTGKARIKGGLEIETCQKCRGRGKIRVRTRCHRCRGTGTHACPRCDGEGTVYQ